MERRLDILQKNDFTNTIILYDINNKTEYGQYIF
jgi:hypothetical protein